MSRLSWRTQLWLMLAPFLVGTLVLIAVAGVVAMTAAIRVATMRVGVLVMRRGVTVAGTGRSGHSVVLHAPVVYP